MTYICQGGCQSFCLSVQSTIEGGACAFGGFLGENSLLTLPSVMEAAVCLPLTKQRQAGKKALFCVHQIA